MRTSRKQTRGAAMVEFALVAPVFVTLLLWSMFLTDLVRTRLKLQEASRFVAFEFTSYNLSDFDGADHDTAFENARLDVETRTTAAYADLDSADDLPTTGFVGGIENLKLTITSEDPPPVDGTLLEESPLGPIGDVLSSLGGVLGSGLEAIIGGRFKFNTGGQVRADVELEFVNKLLPQKMLQREDGAFAEVDLWGGQNLARLKMHNTFTVVADGWSLPDGSDATVEGRRAGRHRGGTKNHGLYTQVDRMTFYGADDLIDGIPGVGALTSFGANLFPAPLGTYVVSHNYGGDGPLAGDDNDCVGPPGYPKHPMKSGMRSFEDDNDEMIDFSHGRCFDTAPFRDEHGYFDGANASLYIQMFMARGEFGFGCQQAEAHDPTTMSANPPAEGDETTQVGCAAAAPP